MNRSRVLRWSHLFLVKSWKLSLKIRTRRPARQWRTGDIRLPKDNRQFLSYNGIYPPAHKSSCVKKSPKKWRYNAQCLQPKRRKRVTSGGSFSPMATQNRSFKMPCRNGQQALLLRGRTYNRSFAASHKQSLVFSNHAE